MRSPFPTKGVQIARFVSGDPCRVATSGPPMPVTRSYQKLPEVHQLPARHLRAGQALLKQSLQKHWPTDLLLGLESQSRVSQECSSQATPVSGVW